MTRRSTRINHYHDTRPERLEFLEALRALVDRYPKTALLGELSPEDSRATIAEYARGHRVHTAYASNC